MSCKVDYVEMNTRAAADLTRQARVIERLLHRRMSLVGLQAYDQDEEYEALRAAWVCLTVRAADARDAAARHRTLNRELEAK